MKKKIFPKVQNYGSKLINSCKIQGCWPQSSKIIRKRFHDIVGGGPGGVSDQGFFNRKVNVLGKVHTGTYFRGSYYALRTYYRGVVEARSGRVLETGGLRVVPNPSGLDLWWIFSTDSSLDCLSASQYALLWQSLLIVNSWKGTDY